MKHRRHLPVLVLGLAVCAPLFAEELRPAAPAPGSALHGRVRDAEGGPLAGAEVLVLRPEAARQPVGGDDSFLRATVGEDSAFTLALPAASGQIHLLVEAAGHATLYLHRVTPDAGPLDLRPAVEARLEGTVLAAATGAPLAGAEVVLGRGLTEEESEVLPGPIRDRLLPGTTSQAKGTFAVAGLAAGLYDLQIRASGFRSHRAERLTLAAGETRRVDVALDPASSIRGAVTGADGKALADALVQLIPDRSPSGRGWWEREAGSPGFAGLRARNGADGAFRFDEIEPLAKLTLRVSHQGHATHERELQAPAPGGTLDLEVRLRAGAVLGGVVLDEEDRPLEGALVHLDKVGGNGDAAARRRPRELRRWRRGRAGQPGADPPGLTGADGRFRLENLVPGDYQVRVGFGGRDHTTGLEVSLADGETLAGQRLVIAPGRPLGGRVLDDAGEPVAGAMVSAYKPGAIPEELAATETGPEGTFEVRGIDGKTCTLRAGAEGYGYAEREDVATDAEGITLTLARTGAVAGRVSLEGGGAPAMVAVSALPGLAIDAAPRSRGMRRPLPETLATDDGAYTYDGVYPGTWDLVFRAPGHVEHIVPGVRVEPGRTTADVNVTLEPGGIIAGTVVRRSDGAPIAGAEVSLHSAGGFRAMRRGVDETAPSAWTEASGSFRLEGVPRGGAIIRVAHPEYAETRVEGLEVAGSGGETIVHVALGGGGSIAGWVRAADGSPVTGAMVGVLNAAAAHSSDLVTDTAGRFQADLLVPGSYVVSWLGGAATERPLFPVILRSETVMVRDGETARVELRAAAGRLTGRVLRGGQPLGGVTLLLNRSGGVPGDMTQLIATTDGEGRYALDGVRAGKCQAYILSEGGGDPFARAVSLTVTVPEGGGEHDFVLPGLYLSGRAIDAESSAAVAGARLEAWSSGGGDLFAASRDTTSSDGSFRIAVAEPGTYTLSATHPDRAAYLAVSLDVEVGGSGAEGIAIRFRRGDQVMGVVLDPDRRPVEGAIVRFQAGHATRGAHTDHLGRFRFPLEPGTTADLTVLAADLAPLYLTGVAPAAGELTLRPTPGGMLDLRVIAEPERLRQARVELRDPSGRDPTHDLASALVLHGGIESDLARTGHLVLAHLPAGSYTLTVLIGATAASVPVRIEEGQKLEIEVTP